MNNCLKESLLNHIYVADPTISKAITAIKPCFEDHMLIIMDLMIKKRSLKQHLKEIGEKIFPLLYLNKTITFDNDVRLHISNLFCTCVFISFPALSTFINNEYCMCLVMRV